MNPKMKYGKRFLMKSYNKMLPNSITDVFFDLDHTLWDFDKNSMLAFKRVFSKHDIQLDIDSFIEVYEPINLEYWKRYREERVSKPELRRGRLMDTFSRFDLKFDVHYLDQLAESYIDELPMDNHLFNGARSILEYLTNKYSLHIITNGFDEVQHLKLINSRIKNHFNSITTSEEIGVKKPNPRIFQAALKKANSEASRSIMIGDSFEADILGAESVGMNTLFYNYRKDSVPEKYTVIGKLSDIRNYL
jgi:putative hydrolase of the HAD superfamily